MKKIEWLFGRYGWFLVALLSVLFGTAVRFYYGLSTDLWNDEAISFFIARDLTWAELFFSTGRYWILDHPPLYYIILKFLLFAGDADWWLRITSLIWFFPSLYLVYKICLHLGKHRSACLGISLFSLHPLLVGLSFQVRPYPLTIFFMLFYIYVLMLNLQKPRLIGSVAAGLLLAACFLLSYASVWLVGATLLFAIYIFFRSNDYQLKESILLSLLIFCVLVFSQFYVLINYLSLKNLGESIAGSVPTFDFEWVRYQLRMLVGGDQVLVLVTLFLVTLTVILKRKKSLQNCFLTLLLVSALVLPIVVSLILYPVFLARQLVLFSLTVVFFLAQFHQNWRQVFILFLLMLIWGVNSWNGYEFLYENNIKKNIERVPYGSILLVFNGVDFINYYLQTTGKNSVAYKIESDRVYNSSLGEMLLKTPPREIIFLTNQFCSQDQMQSCMVAKESLQESICQRHHCRDLLFEL